MVLTQEELEALVRGKKGYLSGIRNEIILEELAGAGTEAIPAQEIQEASHTPKKRTRRYDRTKSKSTEQDIVETDIATTSYASETDFIESETFSESELEETPELEALMPTKNIFYEITDQDLQRMDPSALMTIDYLMNSVKNKNKFTEELIRIGELSQDTDVKAYVLYLVTATELAETLKEKNINLRDIEEVFISVLGCADRKNTKKFMESVLKHGLNLGEVELILNYITDPSVRRGMVKTVQTMQKLQRNNNYSSDDTDLIVDYLTRSSSHNNIADTLRTLDVVKSTGNYTELENIRELLSSDHRHQIIKILRKCNRIRSDKLDELEKLVDIGADADYITRAKQISQTRNPHISVDKQIAVEYIVNSILEKKYDLQRYNLSETKIKRMTNNTLTNKGIGDYAIAYIENVDKSLLECTVGEYKRLSQDKVGCNKCEKRTSCTKRDYAKNIKGMLRAIVAIADSESD